MSEYDHEPTRGLPEELPADEHIIWQGAPDWVKLVTSAFHLRFALVYFAVIAIVAAMRGDTGTAAAMGVFALVFCGLSALFAYGVGRTTVYTLTNKRIVLRIGVALNKCINIPLGEIESAKLKKLSGDAGSIALSLKGMPRMGYVMLWPHARTLRFVRPQPMLRAIPQAEQVATMLFDAASALHPAVVVEEDAIPGEAEGLPA